MRPRWIGALLLALAVAAAFAGLSQWQLQRSVTSGAVTPTVTEEPQPIEAVTDPQQPVVESIAGQLVTVTGSFVSDEFMIFSERLNEGENGYWVVGHFVTEGAGLAVALGWSADEAGASAAINGLDVQTLAATTVEGRYLPSEAPQHSDYQSGELSAVSAPALINVWPTVDPEGVYGGFVVAAEAPSGLETIYSPPLTDDIQVNWLNIFYAAEWVIFAGFAIFLWYRLVKDAWEKEQYAAAN